MESTEQEWLGSYRRLWPKGFMRYPEPAAELPEDTRRFLTEIGLPIGREPAWTFTGRLLGKGLSLDRYYEFGLKGVAPLLLRPDGTVWLVRDEGGEPSYCNGSIEQFAQCLTLACKGNKRVSLAGLSIRELLARVRERYERIDPRAMDPGTPWSFVLVNVEEAERDRRNEFDDA